VVEGERAGIVGLVDDDRAQRLGDGAVHGLALPQPVADVVVEELGAEGRVHLVEIREPHEAQVHALPRGGLHFQRVFQVHVERAAVRGRLEGAHAPRRRAEFHDEAHVAAVEELVHEVLLVLQLLAILGEDLALLGLLGVALEDEAEARPGR
jgi:hypothetical protein